MPSKSYLDFLELLDDVSDLNEIHRQLSKATKGRKRLGYLTRSSTVMLCAAWERYTENILLESIDLILAKNIQATNLPDATKKYISSKVRANKNEIYPMGIADEGWKNIWKGYATNDTESLNTPNIENLTTLFKRHLGIDDFTNMWTRSARLKINQFIKTRGEIAHNGSKAHYVRFNTLSNMVDIIVSNCIQIDHQISKYLKAYHDIDVEWEDQYYRERKRYKL